MLNKEDKADVKNKFRGVVANKIKKATDDGKSKKFKWNEKLFGPKWKHDQAVAKGKAQERYGSYGPNPNRNVGRP